MHSNHVVFAFIFAAVLMEQMTSNGAALATNRTSSALSKFVAALSKPGAFADQVKLLLGEEYSSEPKAKCPEGEAGLECRRMEARNGVAGDRRCPEIDEAEGEEQRCNECQTCPALKPTQWLECCESHFLCCSHLALACQKCDQPELLPFCMKRFKKCFQLV